MVLVSERLALGVLKNGKLDLDVLAEGTAVTKEKQRCFEGTATDRRPAGTDGDEQTPSVSSSFCLLLEPLLEDPNGDRANELKCGLQSPGVASPGRVKRGGLGADRQ